MLLFFVVHLFFIHISIMRRGSTKWWSTTRRTISVSFVDFIKLINLILTSDTAFFLELVISVNYRLFIGSYTALNPFSNFILSNRSRTLVKKSLFSRHVLIHSNMRRRRSSIHHLCSYTTESRMRHR